MTSCAIKLFQSAYTKNREYQIRFNDCVEDRIYKVNPWRHFIDDRSLSYHIKNLNIANIYLNDVDGDIPLVKQEFDITEGLTRTAINKRVAAKLAEIEAERYAYISRKNNFFLFVMLEKFATYDGSKPEVLKTDQDFLFVWTPFPRPVPKEPPCMKIMENDQYMLLPKCATEKPKVLKGFDAPTYFECNYCTEDGVPKDTKEMDSI